MKSKHLQVARPLSLVLSLLMIIALLPVSALAASDSDYDSHWAKNEIQRAIDQKWASVDASGTFRPGESITRAEFIDMINRVMGYSGSADISGYSDVSPDDRYYNALATAVAAGYVQGSAGKLMPNEYITRAQAFVIFARISGLNTNTDNKAITKGVGDWSSVPSWAEGSVAAAVSAGFASGNGGNIMGGNIFSRAEAAVLLGRKNDDVRIFSFPGEYKITTAGSVLIQGSSVIVELGGAKPDNVVIAAGTKSSGIVLTGGATVGTLDIKGKDAIVEMASGTKINTANISSAAKVTGAGSITTANITATGVTIETKPVATNISSGISAVVAGNTVTNNSTVSGGGGSSGGSNSGNKGGSGNNNGGNDPAIPPPTPVVATLTVNSSAVSAGILADKYGSKAAAHEKFSNGIPSISLPLSISGIPDTSTYYAVEMFDPDANDWVHWLAVGPLTSTQNTKITVGAGTLTVAENASYTYGSFPAQGTNGWDEFGYGGPTPPSGTHNYTINVYTLSSNPGLSDGFTHSQFTSALSGKIVGKGTMTAMYSAPLTPNTGLDNDGSGTTISWLPVDGADSYKVYRADSKFGTYSEIEEVTAPETSYLDTDDNGKLSESKYYRIAAVVGSIEQDMSAPISRETLLFGSNVNIYSPNDEMASIQTEAAGVFSKQEAAQFGEDRIVLLFKPGVYTSLDFKVGFYTHVAGLGETPTDTKIPKMTVNAAWLGVPGDTGDSNATCNFWRTIENINITSNTLWAVSQAAPIRRMQIDGNLQLATTSGTKNWASGGFLADSKVTGNIAYGGQQQWITRNSDIGGNTGCNWNLTHVGVNGTTVGNPARAQDSFIDKAPSVQEKPFLYIDDDGDYKVFVPGLRTDVSGTSWSAGNIGVGTSLDLADDFYVAKPDVDTAATINAALLSGKHLLLTPGIYHLEASINVTKVNTVVLGIGLATLINDGPYSSMIISDVDGVKVSGIIFDAGTQSADVLLKAGTSKTAGNSANPILLQDLFFRVGGGKDVGKADVCVELNRGYTIGDDFWVWRADHGNKVSWYQNTTKNGLIVNGDNVTIYALMCEHFHEYQTLWKGDNGKLFFYQSELPYDVGTQASWNPKSGSAGWAAGNSTEGFASYKVADTVNNHEAWGLGVYGVPSRTGPNQDGSLAVHLFSAIEVPKKDGVKIHNACITNLANAGNYSTGNEHIRHIVNNRGIGVVGGEINRLAEYCNPIDGAPAFKDGSGDAIISGNYDSALTITIISPDPSDSSIEIWYTTDGTAPAKNGATSTKYTTPITIDPSNHANKNTWGAVKIRAVAFKGEGLSEEASIILAKSDDLAMFKPAVASSDVGANRSAKWAVNGYIDGDNRWETANQSAQPCGKYNQWIMVDLGAVYDLSKVIITQQSGNSIALNAYLAVATDDSLWNVTPWKGTGVAGYQSASPYELKDGWTIVKNLPKSSAASLNNGQGHTVTAFDTSAIGRYVLMYLHTVDTSNGSASAFSVRGIEVFGEEHVADRVSGPINASTIAKPQSGSAGVTTKLTDTADVSFSAITWYNSKTGTEVAHSGNFANDDIPVAKFRATGKNGKKFNTDMWLPSNVSAVITAPANGVSGVSFTRAADETYIDVTITFTPVTTTYEVTIPNSIAENGLTVSAELVNPPSENMYAAGETVTVKLTSTGTASKAAIYTVGLTSAKVGVHSTPTSYDKFNVRKGDGLQSTTSPVGELVYEFEMPAEDLDDFNFTVDALTNIAEGRTAAQVKSSATNNANQKPEDAFNGNYSGTDNNRWQSGGSDAGRWIMVDLGAEYTISDLVIHWNDNTRMPASFQIDVAAESNAATTWNVTDYGHTYGNSTNGKVNLTDAWVTTDWQLAAKVKNGTIPSTSGSTNGSTYTPIFEGDDGSVIKRLKCSVGGGNGSFAPSTQSDISIANNDLGNVTGRYVRILMTEATGQYNHSPWEIEIYGTMITTISTVDITIDEPILGQTPPATGTSTNYAAPSAPYTATLTSITGALDGNGKFDADTQYTYNFTITAKDGFTLNYPAVKVNGTAASGSFSGDTSSGTVSHEFDATERGPGLTTITVTGDKKAGGTISVDSPKDQFDEPMSITTYDSVTWWFSDTVLNSKPIAVGDTGNTDGTLLLTQTKVEQYFWVEAEYDGKTASAKGFIDILTKITDAQLLASLKDLVLGADVGTTSFVLPVNTDLAVVIANDYFTLPSTGNTLAGVLVGAKNGNNTATLANGLGALSIGPWYGLCNSQNSTVSGSNANTGGASSNAGGANAGAIALDNTIPGTSFPLVAKKGYTFDGTFTSTAEVETKLEGVFITGSPDITVVPFYPVSDPKKKLFTFILEYPIGDPSVNGYRGSKGDLALGKEARFSAGNSTDAWANGATIGVRSNGAGYAAQMLGEATGSLTNSTQNNWLVIDLGEVKTFTDIAIDFVGNGNYARDYTIDVSSDDRAWSDVPIAWTNTELRNASIRSSGWCENDGTIWQNAFTCTNTPTDGTANLSHYLKVGEEDYVATYSANRGGEYPTDGIITGTNGTVTLGTAGMGTEIEARYIRIFVTKSSNSGATGNGPSITSFRVYNDSTTLFRTFFSIDSEDEDLDEDLVEDLAEDLGDENLDDDANPELDPNALEPNPYALPPEDGDDSDLID